MAFNVETLCDSRFESPLPLEKTFAFFSNYAESIGKHFYGLESFSPRPDGSYRWAFKKLAYSGYELQIQFDTKFQADAKNKIDIIPVKGDTPAELSGSWDFRPLENGKGTEVHFKAKLVGTLPLPGLLKSMVTPVAQKEVRKIFDRYIENVKKTLSA